VIQDQDGREKKIKKYLLQKIAVAPQRMGRSNFEDIS
jgi:hypothetical protein